MLWLILGQTGHLRFLAAFLIVLCSFARSRMGNKITYLLTQTLLHPKTDNDLYPCVPPLVVTKASVQCRRSNECLPIRGTNFLSEAGTYGDASYTCSSRRLQTIFTETCKRLPACSHESGLRKEVWSEASRKWNRGAYKYHNQGTPGISASFQGLA